MNTNTQFTNIMGSDGDICIYLGHASILVRINGYKIMFDPIVISKPYGESWTFFPPQFWTDDLYDVDAVVVSHIHQDHYDAAFLKRLDSKVKIFVIGGRKSFEDSLTGNGLTNVVILAPGEIHEIFSGVNLFGLLHDNNQIDASTLIYSENFSVYHGNDNYCSKEILDQFHTVVPNVSIACIPYAYIHWYPFLLDNRLQTKERATESKQLIEKYFDYCVSATKALRAQITIPFGANLVLIKGNVYSKMNMAVKTPLEFADYIRENYEELIPNIMPLNAGDYVVADKNELRVFQEIVETAEQYRSRMENFLRTKRVSREPKLKTLRPVHDFLHEISEIVHLSDIDLDFDIWIELQLDDPRYVRINFGQRIVEAKPSLETISPYYLFKLDETSSYDWLNGSSLEEIIGMRSFLLMRDPDEYRPDVLRIVNTLL